MAWGAWFVALYLLLDVLTPSLPGVFAFEPQQSIEMVRNARVARAHLPSAADVTPSAVLPSLEWAPQDSPLVVAAVPSVRAATVSWWPPPRTATESAPVDPSAAAA